MREAFRYVANGVAFGAVCLFLIWFAAFAAGLMGAEHAEVLAAIALALALSRR